MMQTNLDPTASQLTAGGVDSGAGAGDISDVPDRTKLIVNYIPQMATEEDLAGLFAPLGRIENLKIMRDFKTGYSYGFGFVKYFAEEDAARAIDVLNGINFKNKRLKVSYSRPPGTDMKDTNLYITNLPKDVTEDDVHKLFCSYGEIVQKSVLRDKITGMPRGVAFVRFSKGKEAQAAIADLDGKLIENAMFPLSVRVAEDHGRQKAQYYETWGLPPMPPPPPPAAMQHQHNNRGPMPFRGAMPFRKLHAGTSGLLPDTFQTSRNRLYQNSSSHSNNMHNNNNNSLANNNSFLHSLANAAASSSSSSSATSSAGTAASLNLRNMAAGDSTSYNMQNPYYC